MAPHHKSGNGLHWHPTGMGIGRGLLGNLVFAEPPQIALDGSKNTIRNYCLAVTTGFCLSRA